MHGTGAPCAAITWGFDGEVHIPNGLMFTIGTKSVMVPASLPSNITGWGDGVGENTEGATPKLHVSWEPSTTGNGMQPRYPIAIDPRNITRAGARLEPLAVSRHPSQWMPKRPLVLAIVFLATLSLAACEKPDASYVTSPPVKTLLGTTTGNTAFNPPETAPLPHDPPHGWHVAFALARWSELENGSPSLQIILQVASHPGLAMELWISDSSHTVARWSAGSTSSLTGTVCFQLELERGGEAVPLGDGVHTATVVFREPAGEVVVARRLEITNTVPRLQGAIPSQGSEVFREALACPRGS